MGPWAPSPAPFEVVQQIGRGYRGCCCSTWSTLCMAQQHPSCRWTQSGRKAQRLEGRVLAGFQPHLGTQHPAPLPLPGPPLIKARAQPPGRTSCR